MRPLAADARRIRSTEPARPDEVVAEVAVPSGSSIDRWLTEAQAARRGWSASALERSAALQAWAGAIEAEADPLATLIAREVGKPISEARAEVIRSVGIVRFYAQVALDPVGEVLPGPSPAVSVQVVRRPLGTVLAICPWNFPLAIPVWKLAPALAYGNAVAFKPSSQAVGVASRLVELAHRSVPRAVLGFLPVASGTVADIVLDGRVDGVTFTGSSEVGRSVILAGAGRSVPVQAEMGGHNASVVLDDADLDSAVSTIVGAAMGYAGQKCTATRRVIVDRSVANETTARLVAAIERLAVGDPLDGDTVVGPVITSAARDAVLASVAAARNAGARLLAGGNAIDRTGWFMVPSVLAVGDHREPFVQEETFGPAIAILEADGAEDAVRIANSTRFALAGAVFGSDIHRAASVAAQLDAGMIRVNGPTTGADYWAPFGGHGASGYGPREQGREVAAFLTASRTVSIAS